MFQKIISYIKEVTSTFFSIAAITWIILYIFVPDFKKNLRYVIKILIDNGVFTANEFFDYWKVFSYFLITVCIFTYMRMKSSFSYRKKSCQKNFVGLDDINGNPDDLVSKLIKMSKGRLINLYTQPDDSEGFKYFKNFRSLKVASRYGDVVDYLFCSYKFCDFNIMYIDIHFTDKKSAANFLINQGFTFVERSENIIHFRKDDIHIKIAYAVSSPECIEIYRDYIRSDIENYFYEHFDPTEEQI